LAGIAGACLAQQVDAGDALRIAVCVHGAAADLLVERGVGPVGVGASELPDVARELLNRAASQGQRRNSPECRL
jgi:NAD(P)H-hydrate repair Nnr-like enzyme with NAD(P)H-hydrate dehydratase domain